MENKEKLKEKLEETNYLLEKLEEEKYMNNLLIVGIETDTNNMETQGRNGKYVEKMDIPFKQSCRQHIESVQKDLPKQKDKGAEVKLKFLSIEINGERMIWNQKMG